jgi:hypothetical protein
VLTSNTSVLERRVPIADTYHTYPYEAGWASEAILFVQAEGQHPPLRLQPEISPDGIAWVPVHPARDLAAGQSIEALPLQCFGSWLRLTVTGASAERPATILIHLALRG